MEKGTFTKGFTWTQENSVVKYYTIIFTINILIYQQGKPEAEYVLWDSTNLASVQSLTLEWIKMPCQWGSKNKWFNHLTLSI